MMNSFKFYFILYIIISLIIIIIVFMFSYNNYNTYLDQRNFNQRLIYKKYPQIYNIDYEIKLDFNLKNPLQKRNIYKDINSSIK